MKMKNQAWVKKKVNKIPLHMNSYMCCFCTTKVVDCLGFIFIFATKNLKMLFCHNNNNSHP